jgi:hypothetical protein
MPHDQIQLNIKLRMLSVNSALCPIYHKFAKLTCQVMYIKGYAKFAFVSLINIKHNKTRYTLIFIRTSFICEVVAFTYMEERN